LNQSGAADGIPMIMPWLFSKPFRRQCPEKVRQIKESIAQNYLAKNSAAFERQLNANIAHDTRGRLQEIRVPTLILTGKDDELTTPTMAQELNSAIPNSELLIFEQGGHGLYWETPERFNQAVLDFIARMQEVSDSHEDR
jgi:pimeloyl-ACP methyl ester carboxylesterase